MALLAGRSAAPRRGLARAAVWLVLALAACGTSRVDSEPRFAVMHNTLSALGLAPFGPLHTRTLAEGAEARITFDLPAQCTAFVAVAGAPIDALEAEVVSSSGAVLARTPVASPDAVLQVCIDAPDTLALVARARRGSGSVVFGTWVGALPAARESERREEAVAQRAGPGTCEAPTPLAAGTVNGQTRGGESEHEGSCANTNAPEVVYKLEVPVRQRVTLHVEPRFDAVLYIRKDDCTDSDAEVGCNDDAPNARDSRIDTVLEAGTYYVIVDGYGTESGAFKLNVAMSSVPSLAEHCQNARPLAFGGRPATGTLTGGFDAFHASCGDTSPGPDVPFRMQVPQRSRVRVVHHGADFMPVVHVRAQCTDESSEIACTATGMTADDAAFVGVLAAGTYTVVADATEAQAEGAFSLAGELAPEQGVGVAGDRCADAIPIAPGERTVSGDTFLARDDTSSRCSPLGAPDVFYRFDLPRKSRVSVRMLAEEGRHVFVLARGCQGGSEIACSATIDEVLPPGSYSLAVDGMTEDAFGRYAFDMRVRDAAAQENACRNPPPLVAGRTVSGTTVGAGDKFMTTCGGREDTQGSPDRVHKLVLATAARVRLVLTTPGWDGVLAIRQACADGPGGARAAEVACNNDHGDTEHARIEKQLQAGTYYVIVDGHASRNEGAYTIEYSESP
jgi:hypothetical protein